MNVVDSSGWLEYFADGVNAEFFAPVVEDIAKLVVPSISLYEVFKKVKQQRGENIALQVAATMQQARVVDLNSIIALNAATISLNLKLPMADSIILATARMFNAVLWTQDADFEGIDDVQYIRKL